eukprot:NODE_2394_length_1212_cov_17.161651_g2184_i0.p1 GENE.NODE_2394_length_1212_cov_17.161651_g2184_i0~~NODE_2394_length_1212_cov_17.161651_g2184_i0.p1  ORF type:complete len:335 (-),score=61.25 NODE_2394_length_1212_cov_17.161651_g2184_i0:101-1105(-)
MAFAVATAAFSALSTTKKTVDFLKGLAAVAEEGRFLWRVLDSINPPFRLCVHLSRRYETASFVDAAVQLVVLTVSNCEGVLGRDAGEEDGRPDSVDGWQHWLSHQKDGLARRDALQKLTQQLHTCHVAMLAALQTVAMCVPEARRQPHSDFRFLTRAIEEAHGIVLEFEFGRCQRRKIAAGTAFRWTPSSSRVGKSDLIEVGAVSVVLAAAAGSDERLRILFEPVVESELSEYMPHPVAPAELPSIELCASVEFRRETDLSRDARFSGPIVYGISSVLLLQFEGVGGVPAEVFEAVMVLCLESDGQPLCEVIDPERLEAFRPKMELRGLTFVEK